jgi:hypothetical protein
MSKRAGCKQCGACANCDRCSHCGCCRNCGKYVALPWQPVYFAPYIYPQPYWVMPTYPVVYPTNTIIYTGTTTGAITTGGDGSTISC